MLPHALATTLRSRETRFRESYAFLTAVMTITTLAATSPAIVAFMARAAAHLGAPSLPPPADIFDFGDGVARVTQNLNALVRSGAKTATMSFPSPRPPPWGVGDYSVAVDARGRPALPIRTTELREERFDRVDEACALSEGEGSYEEWREGHRWCWREKRDHDGELFGDVKGRWVLLERFDLIFAIHEADNPDEVCAPNAPLLNFSLRCLDVPLVRRHVVGARPCLFTFD